MLLAYCVLSHYITDMNCTASDGKLGGINYINASKL